MPLAAYLPFLPGVGLAIGLILNGTLHAAGLETNELWCGPSNSIVVVAPARPQPASTLRMIERLNHIRDTADPRANIFYSEQGVKILERELLQATNMATKVRTGLFLAGELLNTGRTEDALQQMRTAEDVLSAAGQVLDPANTSKLRMLKATAMLRMGEQENCLANHNADSCLFPLLPAGVHQFPRGSRGAITLLTEELNDVPQDLSARWLLNVAYMTLGEYPGQVPAQWLIPPRVFQSDSDFPRFPDIAGALGLDVNGLAGGVILDDFDNDGLIDIVTSSWNYFGQLRYFHNDGDGHFSDRSAAAGFSGLMGGLNIQQTDYNNDGLPDIWVMRGAWTGKAGRIPPSLLRNNGDGTFTDVTEQAGLLSYHPTQTSVWFDYDGDGWLDLFLGHETTDPQDPDPCELYHNNHDGTFTECSAMCGLDIKRYVKGVTCADYDNDGRPDLYISCRVGENLLFHNDGPDALGQWKFSDVTQRAGLKAATTFSTWFFDYDNDGWDDIFVSGYAVQNVGDIAADYLGLPSHGIRAKLYHNNHDGTFTDVTTAMGLNKVLLTMGCNFGDLDNDGWLDFYLGTGNPDLSMLIPNRMFHNAEGKFFQDVTTAGGFGHLQKGHAVAVADLDNDGNQDIYEVMGGAYPGDTSFNVLYHNPGSTNHWIKLKLEGVKSNRAAIGARIHITVKTPAGQREIFKTVNSGGSFGSSPLRQEIGLGDATEIESVEIKWPASGTRQVFAGLKPDQCYHVREGDNQATIWNLKPIHFDLTTPRSSSAHQMQMSGGR